MNNKFKTKNKILFGLLIIFGLLIYFSWPYLKKISLKNDPLTESVRAKLNESNSGKSPKKISKPNKSKYSTVVQVTSNITWGEENIIDVGPATLNIVGYNENGKIVFKYTEETTYNYWCKVKSLNEDHLYFLGDISPSGSEYVYYDLNLKTKKLKKLSKNEFDNEVKKSEIRFDDNGQKRGWINPKQKLKNKKESKIPGNNEELPLNEYIIKNSFKLGNKEVIFRTFDGINGAIVINRGINGTMEGEYYVNGEVIYIKNLKMISGNFDASLNPPYNGFLQKNSSGILTGQLRNKNYNDKVTLIPKK